ncbi:MAG: hypothetical protein D6785_08140, partial [Planctomycetota bacterium]
MTQKLEIQIPDIKCAGCVAKIEKALSEFPAVQKVEVHLVKKRAVLEGDSLPLQEILEKIQSLGFHPKISTSKKAVLSIPSMKCAGCVAKIEKALQEMEGVEKVQVQLPEKKGILYLSADTPFSKVVEKALAVLENIGFPATLLDEKKDKEEERSSKLRTPEGIRFIIAVLGSIFIMPLSMGWISFPAGKEVSMVLATIVVLGAGSSFFRNAFLRLRHGMADMDTLIALGSGTALAYSHYAYWTGHGHLYFDSAVMIITFI